jgi:predicted transcriptional regulator
MRRSMAFEAVISILFILFVFIMYLMVAGHTSVVKEEWNTVVGPESYLYPGDNGTLYVFNGNNISLVSGDGASEWSITIPENLSINDLDELYAPENSFRPKSTPTVASYNGTLYVYARPRYYINYTYDNDTGSAYLYNGNYNGNPVNPIIPNQYLKENESDSTLLAISSGGSVMWTAPMPFDDTQSIFIYPSNNRVYAGYSGNLSVLDTNGSLLYRVTAINNSYVLAPEAIDESGDIFTVEYSDTGMIAGSAPNYTVVAYYPNGTLWWQKDLNGSVWQQEYDANVNPEYMTLPIYENGILYIPSENGLVTLYPNGTELWSKDFTSYVELFGKMPFDSQNNIYMVEYTRPIAGSTQVVYQGVRITPSGDISYFNLSNGNYKLVSAYDGIGYYSDYGWDDNTSIEYPSSLNDLAPVSIIAVNLATGQDLWNYTIPIGYIKEITVNLSNVYYLDALQTMIQNNSIAYGYPPNILLYYITASYETAMQYNNIVTLPNNLLSWTNGGPVDYPFFSSGTTLPGSAASTIQYNEKHPELQSLNKSAIGPWKIVGFGTINILPENNTVYISYYMYNYEYPASLTMPPYDDGKDDYNYPYAAVYNRSNLTYMSGILALDSNGQLLWNRPTDSMVTTIAANNSTIYYGTENGQVSAVQVNIAIGLAIAAIVYLLIRFFCVGAVARAKASLNKNEKRNQIYDFIVKNPGLTIYELARGTNINMGTIRYHVFILGMNHKITSYKTDGKYIRYFTNSNPYSKEQQLVLSIMRRDAIGKVLRLLLDNPCMTNVEIARKLNINESVVNRSIKELSEKGIITREPVGKKCLLDDVQREHINMAIKRINGE